MKSDSRSLHRGSTLFPSAAMAFANLICLVFLSTALLGQPVYRAPEPLDSPLPSRADTCGYEVLHVFPHDPDAFTQGLLFDGDTLFEGTGLYGQSSLRRVDLETGQVLQQLNLSPSYFGEGIVVWEDTIIQLTWQNHIAFVYDRDSFQLLDTHTYATEGWGLTHNGAHLIMSDGSSTLYFRDPITFDVVKELIVRDGTTPVTRLNELEYIQGEVYANQWLTNRIARIDPLSGQVVAWIDLTGLRPPDTDVLNGIAWHAEEERLIVTGKLWPEMYEIHLIGCLGLPIFTDEFEAGDLRAWDRAVSGHSQ